MKFGNLIIAGIHRLDLRHVRRLRLGLVPGLQHPQPRRRRLRHGRRARRGQPVPGQGLPLPVAVITTLVVVAVFAYLYDQVVLRIAQDGRRPIEGIVVTFFFTFALSFFIDGVAKVLFGTDVHAAPTLWSGQALTLGSLDFARAGLLVLACAVIIGGAFWLYHQVHPRRQGARGERRELRRRADRRDRHQAVPAADLHRDRGDRRGIRHRGSPITGSPACRARRLAHRVPRRRLRRVPQARPGAGRRAVHRRARGDARRLRQRGVRRHGAVRDPRGGDPRLAARPRLRIGGKRMNQFLAASSRALAWSSAVASSRAARRVPRGGVPALLILVAGAIIVLNYGLLYAGGSVFVCRPATRSSPRAWRCRSGSASRSRSPSRCSSASAPTASPY